MDDPADRREQSTRMVEPSMNRRLVHRDGREHLSAHSCARQDQRVQLLLRDASQLPHLSEHPHDVLVRRRWR